jgi:hypothetical protein
LGPSAVRDMGRKRAVRRFRRSWISMATSSVPAPTAIGPSTELPTSGGCSRWKRLRRRASPRLEWSTAPTAPHPRLKRPSPPSFRPHWARWARVCSVMPSQPDSRASPDQFSGGAGDPRDPRVDPVALSSAIAASVLSTRPNSGSRFEAVPRASSFSSDENRSVTQPAIGHRRAQSHPTGPTPTGPRSTSRRRKPRRSGALVQAPEGVGTRVNAPRLGRQSPV